MNLSPDHVAAGHAFLQTFGEPFILWPHAADQDASHNEEIAEHARAQLQRRIANLLNEAHGQQTVALAAIAKAFQKRDEAIAKNKRETREGADPIGVLFPVPPPPDCNVPHPRLGYQIVRAVPGTAGILPASGAAGFQPASLSDQELLLEMSKLNSDIGRAAQSFLKQKLSLGPSSLSTLNSALLTREDYIPLPPDRARKIQDASRAVCRLMGMSDDEIDCRPNITLFPFAKGRINEELAAQSRWAVLKYCELSGEHHIEFRRLIHSQNAAHPLPKWEPEVRDQESEVRGQKAKKKKES